MHPQHQCLKLRLRGIRAFSTHLEPGGALASASWGNLLEFQCGDGNCPSRFRTPAGQAGQLRKNGAVGLSVRRSESVLLRNDFYARVVTIYPPYKPLSWKFRFRREPDADTGLGGVPLFQTF